MELVNNGTGPGALGHEDIKSLKFDKKISTSRHTLQKLWTSLDSGHMA